MDNDRIKAGIDIVGISNFVTFLKNSKGYRRDLRGPSTATSATRRWGRFSSGSCRRLAPP